MQLMLTPRLTVSLWQRFIRHHSNLILLNHRLTLTATALRILCSYTHLVRINTSRNEHTSSPTRLRRQSHLPRLLRDHLPNPLRNPLPLAATPHPRSPKRSQPINQTLSINPRRAQERAAGRIPDADYGSWGLAQYPGTENESVAEVGENGEGFGA